MCRAPITRQFLIPAVVLMTVFACTVTAAKTVIDMPPPPAPAKQLPATNSEDVTDPSDVVTWRDRRNAADIAGPQRSYLGTVALTRFRRARSYSYNEYYVLPNRFPGYRINFGFQNHYPFDVSFLHGVPTHCGVIEFPWVGFGTHFRFFGTR